MSPQKKKALIIGCGFGGISCVKKLAGHFDSRRSLSITAVNDKPESDFLPMIPDIVGRRISPKFLQFQLQPFFSKIGVEFIQDSVIHLDLSAKTVRTAAGRILNYDYLVISSGSQTNFYGNKTIENSALKINDVSDAIKINDAVEEKKFNTYLISGAGYTGIEIATNLRLKLDKQAADSRVVLVERAGSILGPLPGWMKDYTLKNLKVMNIESITGDFVKNIDGAKVELESGKIFSEALVIWASGVRTADFIQESDRKKNQQGRLEVDEYLRLDKNVFVCGDASLVKYKDTVLRMAVQFSIMQARLAAVNIIRDMKGLALKKYRPVDLGYLVPMANNRSCGIVLGMKLKGRLATFFHYSMCIYRSFGFRNKMGIIRGLLSGGA